MRRVNKGEKPGESVSLWFKLDSSIIYLIHYNNIIYIYINSIYIYIYNIIIYIIIHYICIFLTARNMLGCSNHQIRWIASFFVSTQAVSLVVSRRFASYGVTNSLFMSVFIPKSSSVHAWLVKILEIPRGKNKQHPTNRWMKNPRYINVLYCVVCNIYYWKYHTYHDRLGCANPGTRHVTYNL